MKTARAREHRLDVTKPVALRRLASREREVASLIYDRGEMSAVEVVDSLSVCLSNSSVRSMLNRLVSKNILKRRYQHGKFMYLPFDCDITAREKAIQRLAEDYFQSSLFNMAISAIDMIVSQQPELLSRIVSHPRVLEYGAKADLPARRDMQ